MSTVHSQGVREDAAHRQQAREAETRRGARNSRAHDADLFEGQRLARDLLALVRLHPRAAQPGKRSRSGADRQQTDSEAENAGNESMSSAGDNRVMFGRARRISVILCWRETTTREMDAWQARKSKIHDRFGNCTLWVHLHAKLATISSTRARQRTGPERLSIIAMRG